MIKVIQYGSQEANTKLWTSNGQIKKIVNGMNCFGQFVKPEQKVLKSIYPGVIKADRETMRGDSSKLGTISIYAAESINGPIKIINAYITFDWGTDKNTIDYEALKSCMCIISSLLEIDEPVSILDPGYNLQSSEKDIIEKIILEELGEEREITIFIS